MQQTETMADPGTTTAPDAAHTVPLPVIRAGRPAPIRKSKNSRRRAISLIAVHLLIIGHVVHWLIAGRTLSPVEPSETMYAINEGFLNAGAIFFALAILATLIFGRFFCGWGCHLLAYQDLCGWLMRRIGIKPKPFRARLLALAPLALAIYMFLWPTLVRWCVGEPGPELANHLMTTDFWATFPDWTIAILTFAVCGFVIVYFLGAKGFCTYACPYGGVFALADQGAAGRILVTDACEGCGHCTATCTSNVRVHEEVALYRMVVDPGCMKCMDCVSVCPNNALHFGFAKPPIGAKAKRPGRPTPYDFSLSEELLMVLVGVAALCIYRGLYGQVPLLFSMGLAAVTAFLTLKLARLMRDQNVRLQNLSLKRGGRLTRAGAGFLAGMVVWLAFTSHSAVVRASSWNGHRRLALLELSDEVWLAGDDPKPAASPAHAAALASARASLERADRWGLLPTPLVLHDLVWVYLAVGELDRAEDAARRMIDAAPGSAGPHRGLASVLRRAGRFDGAIEAYRQALALDAGHAESRHELCGLLIELARFDDAVAEYRAGLKVTPDDTSYVLDLAQVLVNLNRFEEARSLLADRVPDAFEDDVKDRSLAHTLYGVTLVGLQGFELGIEQLKNAIDLDPDSAEAQYNLGLALVMQRSTEEGIEHLRRAVEADPSRAEIHYNLGAAIFMTGRPAEAEPHIREAARLNPNDPDALGFLAVILDELHRPEEAAQARARAKQLRLSEP
jgi:tetratricopeptide (TPR) repeat protein/NAD-dependent dihydropyrimidine dehydrogenase PreA subunit